MYGQELNAESYAICRSDMMIKGEDADEHPFGNSFSHDGHDGERFDYLLANPPFGVEWKKVKDEVEDEAGSATPAVSAPACRGSTTARCCSSST